MNGVVARIGATKAADQLDISGDGFNLTQSKYLDSTIPPAMTDHPVQSRFQVIAFDGWSFDLVVIDDTQAGLITIG